MSQAGGGQGCQEEPGHMQGRVRQLEEDSAIKRYRVKRGKSGVG